MRLTLALILCATLHAQISGLPAPSISNGTIVLSLPAASGVAATVGNAETFSGIKSFSNYTAHTAITAPGTPSAGLGRCYIDSTSKAWTCKDDAGVLYAAIKTLTSPDSSIVIGGTLSAPTLAIDSSIINASWMKLVGGNSPTGRQLMPLTATSAGFGLTCGSLPTGSPGPQAGDITCDSGGTVHFFSGSAQVGFLTNSAGQYLPSLATGMMKITTTTGAITTAVSNTDYLPPANPIMSGVIIHSTTSTPASASAACTTGTRAWDTSFDYICVSTNTWKRVAIVTW